MSLLLRSPKDTIAVTVAGATVVAIVVNAMFLQAGRHQSPLFGVSISETQPAAAATTSPLPRARPSDADARPIETVSVAAKPVASPAAPRTASAAPSRNDPLANLIVSSQRVAAIQRALTDYGYGRLKPTGAIGADTQAAIQKFPRWKRRRGPGPRRARRRPPRASCRRIPRCRRWPRSRARRRSASTRRTPRWACARRPDGGPPFQAEYRGCQAMRHRTTWLFSWLVPIMTCERLLDSLLMFIERLKPFWS